MLRCVQAQSQTTPEKLVSNPWHGKGFCEPGQYRSAIERCENGFHSCELNLDIFENLAKILENTANALTQWSISSQKQINRSQEIGTTKQAWVRSVRAVEHLAQRHTNMHESIRRTVIDKAMTYKNENYAKGLLKVRKVNDFEKEFKKAQKPWLELMERISETKDAFHTAQRKLISAQHAGRMIESDVGSSEEHRAKVKESVAARQRKTDVCRSKYEDALKDMAQNEPEYVNRMHKILESTDEFEVKRMQHFAATFAALQKALSLDGDNCHEEMAASFEVAIAGHKIQDDIDYFNQHYGKKPINHWPAFEDVKQE